MRRNPDPIPTPWSIILAGALLGCLAVGFVAYAAPALEFWAGVPARLAQLIG